MKNITIQDELAIALYKFSFGGLGVEQAELKAEEIVKNCDFNDEALSHKGINWCAKQILRKMYINRT